MARQNRNSRNSLSRFISLILRHKPEVAGISLDEHGWANVQALLDGINAGGRYRIDRTLLDEIVRTDAKQRYSFDENGGRIRANQGHSVAVDVELTPCEPPSFLWHGTGEKSRASIEAEGLKPMSRLHVHLSREYETAVNVGTRHGTPVVFRVRSGEMAADGYAFFLSENAVWLTNHVPPHYLERTGGPSATGSD
ncbi:MAG: RNA 2'-phosphotransferase [Kiritimatiellae bacterium]|nr:RNA 2'-phosphotransferase [Kiritimatiellia bacterium]